MFDQRKSLEAFYILLSSLSTAQQEKILEVYLKNGRRICLKVEVANPPVISNIKPPRTRAGKRRRLSLVSHSQVLP